MTGNPQSEFRRAIAGLPESLRSVADKHLQHLLDSAIPDLRDLGWPAEAYGTYLRMLAGSDYAAVTSRQHWAWFSNMVATGELSAPTGELPALSVTTSNDQAAKQALREFRHRQMLHILWREFNGQAPVRQTLACLSRLADRLLLCSHDLARESLYERFGVPRGPSGEAIPLLIVAMGKLGGSELNFSSDVDVIFLYPESGETDGKRSLSANEYFTRLCRRTVNYLEETTPDGFVYRVDTRLRPFGDSGPPVISHAALEAYLLQHGRAWERYAYVKARVVNASSNRDTVRELVDNTIEPFVYRRYLDYSVFEGLRDMKSMIEAEVKKRELADNIKLGPGGIREIEFIVQSLQLVHGGRNEKLRTPELAAAVRELVGCRALPADTASALLEAYYFLRRLENFVQAIRDQQQHDLPSDEIDRARLAMAMQCADWADLKGAFDRHAECVSRHFKAVVFRNGTAPRPARGTDRFAAAWTGRASESDWQELFEASDVPDSAGLAGVLAGFAQRIAAQKIDASAERRLGKLIPVTLAHLAGRENAAETLQRVLTVVDSIVRRSAYISLLNENQAVLVRLIDLCEQSAYLATEIGRFPALLDEMLDPRVFGIVLTANDMQADVRERLRQLDGADSERAVTTLAQFQRATKFRVAIADFNGGLPVMKVSDALTDLAEVVLRQALDIAWQDLVDRHGEPEYTIDSVRRRAGLGVAAYGKFGGIELSYGSDLDLVFLHDSRGLEQQTNGSHPLDNGMFFARLVRRLVHFLTTQTPSGVLYEVDTRLRPSGQSGLLVSNVEAFERYQVENAWTWEHQALLRGRPVAGHNGIAREFHRIRNETLTARVNRETLADDVRHMRQRMLRELDKSDDERFDLKVGIGGIGELEFLVQYLVLRYAADNAAVIYYPDNIRQLGTLAAAGFLPGSDVSSLQEIYRRYREVQHHLALESVPAVIGADEFVDERAYVHSIWCRELG